MEWVLWSGDRGKRPPRLGTEVILGTGNPRGQRGMLPTVMAVGGEIFRLSTCSENEVQVSSVQADRLVAREETGSVCLTLEKKEGLRKMAVAKAVCKACPALYALT